MGLIKRIRDVYKESTGTNLDGSEESLDRALRATDQVGLAVKIILILMCMSFLGIGVYMGCP